MTKSRWVPFVAVLLAVSAIAFHPSLGSSDTADTTSPTFEVQAIYDQPLWDYILIRVRASEAVKDMAVTVTVSTQGSKSISEPVSMTAILGATVYEGRFTPQKGWGDIGRIVVSASDIAGNLGASVGTFDRVQIMTQQAKTEGELKKLVEELNRVNRFTRGPMKLEEARDYTGPIQEARLNEDGSLRAVATDKAILFYGKTGKVVKEVSIRNTGDHLSVSEEGEQWAIVSFPPYEGESLTGPVTLTLYDGSGGRTGAVTMWGAWYAAPSDIRGKVVLRNQAGAVIFADVTTGHQETRTGLETGGVSDESYAVISGDGKRVAVMANHPGSEPLPSASDVSLFDIDGNLFWRRMIPKAAINQQLWISRTGKFVNAQSILISGNGQVLGDYQGRGYAAFLEDESGLVLTKPPGGLLIVNTQTAQEASMLRVLSSGQLFLDARHFTENSVILSGTSLHVQGLGYGTADPTILCLDSQGQLLSMFLIPFRSFSLKGHHKIITEAPGIVLILDEMIFRFTFQ